MDGADHQQVAHPLKTIAQLSLTAASFSQPPSQFSCQELASDALVQLDRESWKVCFGMEGKLWEAEMGPFLTSHRTESLRMMHTAPQDCDQLCVRVHLVAMQMARLSHLSLNPEWLNIETMG